MANFRRTIINKFNNTVDAVHELRKKTGYALNELYDIIDNLNDKYTRRDKEESIDESWEFTGGIQLGQAYFYKDFVRSDEGKKWIIVKTNKERDTNGSVRIDAFTAHNDETERIADLKFDVNVTSWKIRGAITYDPAIDEAGSFQVDNKVYIYFKNVGKYTRYGVRSFIDHTNHYDDLYKIEDVYESNSLPTGYQDKLSTSPKVALYSGASISSLSNDLDFVDEERLQEVANASYMGNAKKSTNPVENNNSFYTDTEKGEYSNFKNNDGNKIEVKDGESLVLLSYNKDDGYWTKSVIDIPLKDVQEKLDDLSKKSLKSNYFTKQDVVSGLRISSNDKIKYTSSYHNDSLVLEAEKGDVLSIKRNSTEYNDRFQLAFVDEKPKEDNDYSHDVLEIHKNDDGKEILRKTAPTDTKYAVVYLSSDTKSTVLEEAGIKVIKNDILKRLEGLEDSLGALEGEILGKDITEDSEEEEGVYITVGDNARYRENRVNKSLIVPVDSNKTYSVVRSNKTNNNRFRVGFFDEKPDTSNGDDVVDALEDVIIEDDALSIRNAKAPEGSKYMIVNVHSDTNSGYDLDSAKISIRLNSNSVEKIQERVDDLGNRISDLEEEAKGEDIFEKDDLKEGVYVTVSDVVRVKSSQKNLSFVTKAEEGEEFSAIKGEDSKTNRFRVGFTDEEPSYGESNYEHDLLEETIIDDDASSINNITAPEGSRFIILTIQDDSNISKDDIDIKLYKKGDSGGGFGDIERIHEELYMEKMAGHYKAYTRRQKTGIKQGEKRFNLFHFSDVHHLHKDARRNLQELVKFSKHHLIKDDLDVLISTGDNCNGSPGRSYDTTDNEMNKYMEDFMESDLPILNLIGNHDKDSFFKGGRDLSEIHDDEELYEKFFVPAEDKWSDAGMSKNDYNGVEDKCYYYADFDDHKIRVIGLDNYQLPQDTDSDGKSIYPTSLDGGYYDQEQIDWLEETLQDVPEDYALIVLNHGSMVEGHDFYGYPQGWDFIPSVIDAWKYGKKHEHEYTNSDYSELDTSKTFDFEDRGTGHFICYLGGHTHATEFLDNPYFPEQKHIIASCQQNVTSGGKQPDMPLNNRPLVIRGENQEIRNSFLCHSIDTKEKKIFTTSYGAYRDTRFDNSRRTKVINYESKEPIRGGKNYIAGGKNYFETNMIEDEMLIHEKDGIVKEGTTRNYRCAVMETEEAAPYFISRHNTDGDRFRVCFTEKDPRGEDQVDAYNYIRNDNGKIIWDAVCPYNCKYLVIYLSMDYEGDLEGIQVQKSNIINDKE